MANTAILGGFSHAHACSFGTCACRTRPYGGAFCCIHIRSDRACRARPPGRSRRISAGAPARSAPSATRRWSILADLLNKEMPDYRITVLPMPGAVMTVKGYATNDLDAMYASDDALREFAADSGRFKGFKANMKRQPVQSMWMYHARRRSRHQGQQRRQDQEVGRSDRQEGLHRAAAVRHPPASRERAGRGRRQAHLHAGRPVDGRLAARLRLHRRHDRLLHRRHRAGAVARRRPRWRSTGPGSIRARTSLPS